MLALGGHVNSFLIKIKYTLPKLYYLHLKCQISPDGAFPQSLKVLAHGKYMGDPEVALNSISFLCAQAGTTQKSKYKTITLICETVHWILQGLSACLTDNSAKMNKAPRNVKQASSEGTWGLLWNQWPGRLMVNISLGSSPHIELCLKWILQL